MQKGLGTGGVSIRANCRAPWPPLAEQDLPGKSGGTEWLLLVPLHFSFLLGFLASTPATDITLAPTEHFL